MSKRSADRQITKDDPESGDEAAAGSGEEMEQQGGTWTPASNAVVAGRVIVKARRKAISAPTGVAMPAFNFGAAMPTASTTTTAAIAPPTSVPSSAAFEKPNIAPSSAAVAKTSSSTTPLTAPTDWKCSVCDTENKPTDNQCSVCDEPRAPATATTASSTPAVASSTLATVPTATTKTNGTESSSTSTADQWECSMCMVGNKLTADKCAACDEARPANSSKTTTAPSPTSISPSKPEPSVTKTPSFTAPPATANTAAFGSFATATPFSFSNVPSATTSTAPDSAPLNKTFSFGSSEASATSSTFGSVPSFGNVAAFSTFGAAVPFQTFGSVAKSDSGFKAASGDASGTGASGVVQFEPSSTGALLHTNEETKEEFKNRTKELTGEEDDEVHLKMQTKVYQQKSVPVAPVEVHPEGEVAAAAGSISTAAKLASTTDGAAAAPLKMETKYVEIGSGELHVNTLIDPNTNRLRARLVLREDRTKRSVLNAPLLKELPPKLESDKYVKFVSFELDGKTLATFLLRFKEKAQAEEVLRAMETAIDTIKADTSK